MEEITTVELKSLSFKYKIAPMMDEHGKLMVTHYGQLEGVLRRPTKEEIAEWKKSQGNAENNSG